MRVFDVIFSKNLTLKRSFITGFLLGFLAVITGYLLSSISFVGRTGINFFYEEYRFLKTWWKGALLVYIVWTLLSAIQSYVTRKASKASSNTLNIVALVIAIAGLYFSYNDFRNTMSHRLLGERFHLGVYLFWLVWIAISIMQLLKQRSATTVVTQDKNVTR